MSQILSQEALLYRMEVVAFRPVTTKGQHLHHSLHHVDRHRLKQLQDSLLGHS
jgi:hypothetical protein